MDETSETFPSSFPDYDRGANNKHMFLFFPLFLLGIILFKYIQTSLFHIFKTHTVGLCCIHKYTTNNWFETKLQIALYVVRSDDDTICKLWEIPRA